jgi:hypothetical protein
MIRIGNFTEGHAVKRVSKPRLILRGRPDTGVGEWLAAMVRGRDALEFLERSRELAAEAVIAAPARLGSTPQRK